MCAGEIQIRLTVSVCACLTNVWLCICWSTSMHDLYIYTKIYVKVYIDTLEKNQTVQVSLIKWLFISLIFHNVDQFCFRIIKPIGINFFIAPTPEMDVERIEVHIKINPHDFEYNTVPALLIWDSYAFNSKTKCMCNSINSF